MKPSPAVRQQRAKARYEALRTALGALIVLVVLGSLVMLLLIGGDLRDQNATIRELAEQNRSDSLLVADLLDRQRQNDLNRQLVIDSAVAAISLEQREALAEHDRSVKDFLTRTLNLVEQEVNAPASQENAPIVVPAPPPPLFAPAPRPLPPALARKLPIPPPPPTPAAPAPPPCDPIGKSGKCRE